MSKMGDRIRQKRIENKMTMDELGSKVGVNKSAINKYEKGIVENIKRSTIKEMALIFDCSPTWLMGFDDDPDNDEPIKEIATDDAMILLQYHQLSAANQEVLKATLSALLDSQSKSQ